MLPKVSVLHDSSHTAALLRTSPVKIAVEDPASDKARFCIERFADEVGNRGIAGLDASAILRSDPQELAPPRGLFLMATLRGEPIGSAALGFDGKSGAMLHRMWVAPTARGLGVGRQLMDEIERKARKHGVTAVRLETNSALPEAIALYRRSGYVEVDAFSHDSPADHWFEKRLG